MDEAFISVDILREVLSYLDVQSILSLSAVCKRTRLLCRLSDSVGFKLFCCAFSLNSRFIVLDDLPRISWTLPCCGLEISHKDLLNPRACENLWVKSYHFRLQSMPPIPQCKQCRVPFRNFDHVLQAAYNKCLALDETSWFDVTLRLRSTGNSTALKLGMHSAKTICFLLGIAQSLTVAYMYICMCMTGTSRHWAPLASVAAFIVPCAATWFVSVAEEMIKVPTVFNIVKARLRRLTSSLRFMIGPALRVSSACFGASVALTTLFAQRGSSGILMAGAALSALGFAFPQRFHLLVLGIPCAWLLGYFALA